MDSTLKINDRISLRPEEKILKRILKEEAYVVDGIEQIKGIIHKSNCLNMLCCGECLDGTEWEGSIIHLKGEPENNWYAADFFIPAL